MLIGNIAVNMIVNAAESFFVIPVSSLKCLLIFL